VSSRPALDKEGAPRHDSEAVIRTLRFLALFTALFVVSVRGSSSASLAMACAALASAGADRVCVSADEPREQEEAALAAAMDAADDDTDDDADTVVAPSTPRIRVLAHGAAARARHGALAAELALASHARSLERPPRA